MKYLNVKRLIKYIFIIGLFLLPLVFWPTAYIAYEIPKVWFFLRWVEILVFLGLIRQIQEKEIRHKAIGSVLVYLVLAFVVLGAISSLVGVDLTKSVWGNYYRMDGASSRNNRPPSIQLR